MLDSAQMLLVSRRFVHFLSRMTRKHATLKSVMILQNPIGRIRRGTARSRLLTRVRRKSPTSSMSTWKSHLHTADFRVGGLRRVKLAMSST